MSEEAQPVKPIIPDLNRKKVVDRVLGGATFFGWEDFGVYTLSLKKFAFGVGEKKNPHFTAECVVLDSDNAKWSKGDEVSIYFSTGRPGTQADSARPERDDAYLASFLRAVYKVNKGEAYDNNNALAELMACTKETMALFEAGALQFRFTREKKPKTVKVLHPVTKEVLQEVNRVFNKDTFERTA